MRLRKAGLYRALNLLFWLAVAVSAPMDELSRVAGRFAAPAARFEGGGGWSGWDGAQAVPYSPSRSRSHEVRTMRYPRGAMAALALFWACGAAAQTVPDLSGRDPHWIRDAATNCWAANPDP